MTPSESKLIKQALKVLTDNGLITQETLTEITTVKEADGKKKIELIDRYKAMEMLGVSYQTLINYEKSGELKPFKLAGKRLVRYGMENVESLLEGRKSA